MADDATTGGTPGSGGTPGQAGQAGAQSQASATGGKPGADGTSGQADDTSGLKSALQREREDKEAAQRELRTLREKDLPEAERKQRRLTELETAEKSWHTERQDLRMEAQAVRVAAKLGFADAEDALGWLARNRTQVDFDDQANPTNLERLLRELLKTKPHLLAETARPRGSAEGGARGTGSGVVDFNAQLRRAAGR